MGTGRRRPLFTEEELEEMRRADAEIEADFRLTQEDIAFSRNADREAKLSRKDNRGRKIAENQRAYREANKDKIAEQKRAYREANKEKIADYQAAYYEANKQKLLDYQREYRRRKREEKKNAASGGANTGKRLGKESTNILPL